MCTPGAILAAAARRCVSYEAGYAPRMTETPKELAKEAGRGRSERTPWIALTGVTLVVGAVVLVIVAAALLLYYFV